jgi:hypothetical protein
MAATLGYSRISDYFHSLPSRPAKYETKRFLGGALCLLFLLVPGGLAYAQTTLTPATLAFGFQPEDTPSAAKTATFKNTQTVALTISSIVIFGGTAPGDYGLDAGGDCPLSPNTLGAGEKCSIPVTFTPSGVGNGTGELWVTTDASNSPQSIVLTGTGTSPVTVSLSSLYLGTVHGGDTSAAKSVTLTNHQNLALTFSKIVTTGDFAIASNTCGTGIAAGAKCTVGVTFSPTATGTRSGDLTFSDNAVNSPQTVSLSGTGYPPVTFSPASLAFTSQIVGRTSGAQTVTLKNRLTTSVTVSTPVATGDFGLAGNTCGASVGAGRTCTVGVTFTPTAAGSRTGALTISYGAFGSPIVVALSGTGRALVSIAVTPANPIIAAGYTEQFTATGTYSDGSTQNLTSTATWGSSAPGVATISAGGLATGVSKGASTISATMSSITGSTTLTVTRALVSIAVTPANPSIAAGNTQQFTATGTYIDGSTQNLTAMATWSSSAPAVATIAAGGLAKGLSTGTSTISAAVTGITGSTTLTVTAAVLVSIAVTPANPWILPVQTQQFTATGTYSDGSTQNLTSTATWSSSAPSVATISTTGLASAVAWGQTTVEAALGAINGSTTLYVAGFVLTGSMETARYAYSATLLNNGMVLVAGGCSEPNCDPLATAELYNPATGTFTPTGSLKTARVYHTATLLNDGMVLVAGGYPGIASAELYNPATGTFSYTSGSLNTGRGGHTATLLNNGLVLLAAGGNFLASAELYDPATESFTYTAGSLSTGRSWHTATLLDDGRVLIAGGVINGSEYDCFIANAELYNPATGTFTYTTGNMNSARALHTATLLNNGMVLMAGGYGPEYIAAESSAELYNPATGVFTLTGSMNNWHAQHTATLLSNGMVLVAGGSRDGQESIATSELYNPSSWTFSYTGSLNAARRSHTATLLESGMVLVAGGNVDEYIGLASAELYVPLTLTPPNLESIAITPATSTLSPGGTQQFIATGTFSDGSTQQLASVTWSTSDPAVAQITNDWSNHGVGLALAAGTVTITATDGSVSGTATLTVQ